MNHVARLVCSKFMRTAIAWPFPLAPRRWHTTPRCDDTAPSRLGLMIPPNCGCKRVWHSGPLPAIRGRKGPLGSPRCPSCVFLCPPAGRDELWAQPALGAKQHGQMANRPTPHTGAPWNALEPPWCAHGTYGCFGPFWHAGGRGGPIWVQIGRVHGPTRIIAFGHFGVSPQKWHPRAIGNPK